MASANRAISPASNSTSEARSQSFSSSPRSTSSCTTACGSFLNRRRSPSSVARDPITLSTPR